MLVGFKVNDIENVWKELEKKNVKFYKKLTPESFGKHAIIEDPDGHLISIVEIPAKDELTQIPYYQGFAPAEGLTWSDVTTEDRIELSQAIRVAVLRPSFCILPESLSSMLLSPIRRR